MARHTAVDLEGMEKDQGGLTFHDFHSGDTSLHGTIGGGSIEPEEDYGDSTELLQETHASPSSSSSSSSSSWISLLTLDYYQGFFDVTTGQVLRRVVAATVPLRPGLVSVLRPNPDLYGPFWLCMTLILTTAVSGNLSRAFEEGWEFHFHEVTVLGTAVYSYTWAVPCVWWGLLWWRGTRERYTLLELLAIYGYCIAVFIPITLLWVMPSEVLRWILLAVGVCLSGSVLVLALWQPLKMEGKRLAIAVMVLAFLMHTGMAIGFKFFYFNSALSPEAPLTNSTPTNSTPIFFYFNSALSPEAPLANSTPIVNVTVAPS